LSTVAHCDVFLPAQFVLDGAVLGNRIQQLRRPSILGRAEVRPYNNKRIRGNLVTRDDGRTTLISARRIIPPSDVDEVLLVPAGDIPTEIGNGDQRHGGMRWLAPCPIQAIAETALGREDRCAQARGSWEGRVTIRTEERADDGRTIAEGLRPPQVGALHATLAHWTVTTDPATIVMPTGTGKTDTMLALLVHQRFARLLVVVPTAPLRDQTVDKFLTLGVLSKAKVVDPGIHYPVVGTLAHRPKTPDEVEAIFHYCNVIVTTMAVVSGCTPDVQRAITDVCSHLFIDEAHHISAPTWDTFRRSFQHRPIVQFTATPFRTDGKQVEGKPIYTYPLRKAQEEKYFKPITFRGVRAYNAKTADAAIARAAIDQLERDRSLQLDHLVMARASSIDRAIAIHEIYQQLAPGHHPLLIHSKQSDEAKRAALRCLRDRRSRVIVCVDMLGEGFDLPQLKIAALHDMHKSLAITLQFTGRFTRTAPDIGDATMIANMADAKVDESLRALYAEDADWNVLLRRLSEGATGREARRSAFLDAFVDAPGEIPLRNVFPKMSTVVFRTTGNAWHPERVRDVIDEKRLYKGPIVNHSDHVLIVVTRERERLPWGDIKGLYNTTWDLYLMHWDAVRRLLFIHSSNKDSLHEDLAEAVAGDDVTVINGMDTFRSLHGIHRLMLMNLGLKHSFNRTTRFTMHVGSDILRNLTTSQLQNRITSNLFGRGYENGNKASLGCSYKGRIWSHRIAYDIGEWVEWCDAVGTKLLDASISFEGVIDHVMEPERVESRPPLVPIAIDWPDECWKRDEDTIEVDIAGEVVPFFEAGLELVDHTRDAPIRVRIFTETHSVEYEVRFTADAIAFAATGRDTVAVTVGQRRTRKRHTLTEWFKKHPPDILFEGNAVLQSNELFRPRDGNRRPFALDRIGVWDWTGTDIEKESQWDWKGTGPFAKMRDSIQYRVIQHLLRPDHAIQYDVVFDDDDSNEAADVVAIKVANDDLIVRFYHCKFSTKANPGARVEDLYTVCGQAARSVAWKERVASLFTHLRLREVGRQKKHGESRFERGNLDLLEDIARRAPMLRADFTISIVQPGLSKRAVKPSHLELLAMTEVYLQETGAIPFGVIVHD